jgi:hypothetical protein
LRGTDVEGGKPAQQIKSIRWEEEVIFSLFFFEWRRYSGEDGGAVEVPVLIAKMGLVWLRVETKMDGSIKCIYIFDRTIHL